MSPCTLKVLVIAEDDFPVCPQRPYFWLRRRTSLSGSVLIMGSPSGRAQGNLGKPGPKETSSPLTWTSEALPGS